MKALARIITALAFKIFFKLEVINRENFPAEGPVLLCANHNSMLDMFFLGVKIDRWIYWMAKEELFKNTILSFLIRKLGAFPVKRGTGDVDSIKHAYRLLSENKAVGIFPHGTRIDPSRIETVKIKSGAAMIAAKTGVPIVPAAVHGNYKIFSKMTIIFGKPFTIERKDKKLTKEELAEISRDIIKRIYSLSEVGT